MKSFRDLQVWEKAHQLTLAVYVVTADFPREELYGLTSQIRRASSSIPANIAEGVEPPATTNCADSLTLPWAPPASWNIICSGERPQDAQSIQLFPTQPTGVRTEADARSIHPQAES